MKVDSAISNIVRARRRTNAIPLTLNAFTLCAKSALISTVEDSHERQQTFETPVDENVGLA